MNKLKIGELINLNEEIKCFICGKTLEFKWKNSCGDRKFALCCGKEYWVLPSSIYRLELIKNDTYK